VITVSQKWPSTNMHLEASSASPNRKAAGRNATAAKFELGCAAVRRLRAGCTDRQFLLRLALGVAAPGLQSALASQEWRAPAAGRAINGLASASAPTALSTIPAAVALPGFAPNVFVLTCTPQAPAVPALILGLLDHAFASDAIAREGCGRSFRKSKGAHAGSYHYPENGGSHNSSLGVGGLGPALPVPPVAQINQFPS